jgi:hypothetical protein
MGRFHAAAHFAAPPEVAFDVFTDASRMGEWFPRARRVANASGPINHLGVTYSLLFPWPARADCEVVAVDRPLLHTREYVLRPFGVAGHARMRFRDEGSGSRIDLDGEYRMPVGRLGRMLDRPLRRAWDRQAATELRRLKPLVERAAREPDRPAAESGAPARAR